jgi:hypothetical protein
LSLCVTGSGRGSGAGGDGWYPGVAGEGVADGGEDVVSVLGCGRCVPADGVPVPGGFLRAEPAADFLLGFRWSCVPFSLVARGGNRGVGQEPQDVGFAVPEAFRQEAGRGLLLAGAGDAADFGQPGEHAVPEQPAVFCDRGFGYGGQALVAGEVGLVDEGTQLAGDLGCPDRVWVGLGGVLQVAKEMGFMPTSA